MIGARWAIDRCVPHQGEHRVCGGSKVGAVSIITFGTFEALTHRVQRASEGFRKTPGREEEDPLFVLAAKLQNGALFPK